MTDFNIFLFDDFETLDVFGPVEIIGQLEEVYTMKFFSIKGGIITSKQKTQIVTKPYTEVDFNGILFIPGGKGTRKLVHDEDTILILKKIAKSSLYCITVCTGTALLAKTKLLNGVKATSNKKAFDWVKSMNLEVHWIYKARWVNDNKYYTSSGVSAGMDMILGFISDKFGKEKAMEIADSIEYVWNDNPEEDMFAK
ncbi:dimethyladenosine transferase [Clostridium gelidum]|uniref:Dimethyladenosine transferase n=1 Tax=Clostridium gelidum TaxID=704125 RepID=A0ABM7T6E7_9CLOT|nr:DJ-1/PfpI family protein [Clostridium gelidum]BCZ46821.1 dimethyladenosine transferase [Clostridium gelidum]